MTGTRSAPPTLRSQQPSPSRDDRQGHGTSNGGAGRLLVFTLGAKGERRRRRLLPESLSGWELAFHRRCLESVLAEGRACGLELAVASPSPLALSPDVERIPQAGVSFGDRLTAAANKLFDRPGLVVIVGTDSPELSRAHLDRAIDELAGDSERVVIGPSLDGGFYLLACARPIEGLAGVRWCRHDTLETLLELLDRAGRPVLLLPALEDIDRSVDFEAWLGRKGHNAFRARVWGVFVSLLLTALDRVRKRPSRPIVFVPLDDASCACPPRAPPLAA